MGDVDLERVAPRARPGGLQDDPVDVDLGRNRAHVLSVRIFVRCVHDADHECVAAPVEEEVPHGVAEAVVPRQPAERPLEVAESEDRHRVVDGPRGAVPRNAVIDVATPVIGRLPLGIS